MSMLVSLTLRAIDRLSKPVEAGTKAIGKFDTASKSAMIGAAGAAAAVDELAPAAASAGRAINATTRSVERMTPAMVEAAVASAGWTAGMRLAEREATNVARAETRVGRAAYDMGYSIGAGARYGGRALLALDRQMQISAETAGAMANRVGGFIGNTVRNGFLAATGAGIAAVYSIVKTGAQFEQFQVQLEGLEGSSAAAKQSMAWVQQFAKETPYNLEQVMDSFVRMRTLGIDPTHGALRSLGDASSAMNKQLLQAVEMIADAQTFQFERLKEFGVNGSMKGQTATFSYVTKAGKSASITVKKNAIDIQRALLEIFDSKFAGGMERQSRTLTGVWHNLGDEWTCFAKKLAEGGFNARITAELTQLLNFFQKADKDGSMDRWATKTSNALGKLTSETVRFVKETDWHQISADITSVGGVLRDAAHWAERAQKFMQMLSNLGSGHSLVFGDGVLMLTNPGAAMLQRQVAAERPFNARGGGGVRGLPNGPRRLGPPVGASRPLLYPDQRNTPAQMGGKISIELTTAPGTRGRITHASSVNKDVPFDVTRGRVATGG